MSRALDELARELRRRDALALPSGLSPEQRAIVRSERVKREYGPRSPLWRRCIAFRNRLLDRMSEAEFWTTWYAVSADGRRRSR